MTRRFKLFVRGLSTNWIGTAGVVLTTSAFFLFLFMELLRVLGVATNAYIGLLTYLTLPALFVLGLLLIPLGWRRFRKAAGKTTKELFEERFTPELAQRKGLFASNVAVLIAALTLVNVLFLGAGGARMLQFMDEPVFCGTACHSVMHPEWTTYQVSSHARVKCVGCHVGEGAGATVDAKLNGVWQMVSATFDLFERPIPTPVHNLRPSRETCEKCHWPDKFYGRKIRVFTGHGFDRESTPRYTTLALKVGSGTGATGGTIHWHIAAKNQVRYLPADARRETMRWVEVRREDGSFERYAGRRFAGGADGDEEEEAVRILDCVDCHNRATHVYEDPERAVDGAIDAGRLDRALPFVKRAALNPSAGPLRACPGRKLLASRAPSTRRWTSSKGSTPATSTPA